MQIVHNADQDVFKVWGEGKARPAVYRLLTYVLSSDVDGGTLLHNMITGEMLFLTSEEMQQLSALPCDYAPWMDELIRKRFLVKQEADDMRTVDQLRLAFRTIGVPNVVNKFVVATTTNCNARCFYCYQYGIAHETMSDETADKLLDFIEKNHGDEQVVISWFGGEPLVGIRQIDRISRGLKERGIDFISRMISNGYLFDEETINRCQEDWHLKYIQITLDGTEEVYNEIKAYVSPGDNPYQRVLRNIDRLDQNGVTVNIRLNLGFHNAENLSLLADELIGRFADRKHIYVYPATVYDDCGSKPLHYNPDELAQIHEKWKGLSQKLAVFWANKPRGDAKKSLPHLVTAECMASGDDALLVTPGGKFTKCEHYLNDHFVGDVEHGITDKAEIGRFKEINCFPGCEKCPLFPACFYLKLCASKRECNSVRIHALLNGQRENMKLVYEEFLRDNKHQEEAKAPSLFRKGETE